MARHRHEQQNEPSKARMLQMLHALHTPFEVWEHCPHTHAEKDTRAFFVPGVGRVCEKGLVARVCTHCCTDENGQTKTCATDHDHDPEFSICPTMAIVEGRNAPWRT
jgi:hypothetical protein